MSQPDLSGLCLHSFTNKPWNVYECVENYARAGIGGISLWVETLADESPQKIGKLITDAGLDKVSLVRGGFFTGATTEERQAAIAKNEKLIDLAATLGFPIIVLVCGATPGQTPMENLAQISEGLDAILPRARDKGIRLAVEPLHPKYAGDRCAVASMSCANWLCDQINDPLVGIAADLYHIFWEHDLDVQLETASAKERLFAYHICDFKPAFEHPLMDRGIMGEGCLPLRALDQMVRQTGFSGPAEVEIFSRRWWSENQHDFLDEIIRRYREIYLQTQ